jgi:hypothetical protein
MCGQCPPDLAYQIPNDTLTCYSPTIIAIGSSTTTNTIIQWYMPTIPSLVNSNSVVIGFPSGGISIPPPFPCTNYTVVATNTVLGCSTQSIITICENFKLPIAQPTIISTNTLACPNSVSLSIGNSTVTSGAFGGTITGPWWINPCGNFSQTAVFTTTCPGIHTLQVTDSYNGCKNTGTVLVGGTMPDVDFQVISLTSSSLNCDGVFAISTSPPNGYILSTNSGILHGDTLSNLCYGWVKVCMTLTNTGCTRCDSTIMMATSIDEIDLGKEILVYPNPSGGSVNFLYPQNSKIEIKVFDIEGKETEKVVSINSTTSRIELKNGIYFAEFYLNGSVIRKKLAIIEH